MAVDLKGREIPERYLAGLPAELRRQRIRELTASRDAYRRGDFSELRTDVTARKMGLVKQSAYTSVAKRRGIEWRGDAMDMARRVLSQYGGSRAKVDDFARALDAVFRKGLAAWKSGGHRPGATAQNWAVARVNSLVVGGKAAWTADRKQFSVLPQPVRADIVRRLPEVFAALEQQGRKSDVAYIESQARANPVTRPVLHEQDAKRFLRTWNRRGPVNHIGIFILQAPTEIPVPWRPRGPIRSMTQRVVLSPGTVGHMFAIEDDYAFVVEYLPGALAIVNQEYVPWREATPLDALAMLSEDYPFHPAENVWP